MLQKLFLILFPLIAFAVAEDNLIEWSADRKLTWQDFRATPDPTSRNAALTNSNIKVEFGINNKGLTHTITCRFNKSLSWGRIKTPYILNHEQGHFDIAEIHARLLHKELEAYTFNSKTVNKDINRIYNAVMEEHVQFQKNYDDLTNHSLDTTQQARWDKKIALLLKELGTFSQYK